MHSAYTTIHNHYSNCHSSRRETQCPGVLNLWPALCGALEPHSSPEKQVLLLPPVFRCRNRGTERLSKLPESHSEYTADLGLEPRQPSSRARYIREDA